MIVEIGSDRSTVLLEPEDTSSFKLVAPRDLSEADLTDALKGIADVTSTDHVWVFQPWIREKSGLAASAEWQKSFDKMLGFARSKNWLRTADEAIRAHVERR